MDWFLYNIDLRHEIVKQYPKRFCDLFVTLGEKFKEILEFLKIIENRILYCRQYQNWAKKTDHKR